MSKSRARNRRRVRSQRLRTKYGRRRRIQPSEAAPFAQGYADVTFWVPVADVPHLDPDASEVHWCPCCGELWTDDDE